MGSENQHGHSILGAGGGNVRRVWIGAACLAALLLVVLVLWLAGRPSKARSLANFKQLTACIMLYAADHGVIPPALEDLYPDYLDDPELLSDPSDRAPVRRGEHRFAHSYEYVGSLPRSVLDGTIICYSRKGVLPGERLTLSLEPSRGVSTGRFTSEDILHGTWRVPSLELQASYEALIARMGDKVTDSRLAELRRFYEIADE